MSVIPSLRINGVGILPSGTEFSAGGGSAEAGLAGVLYIEEASAQTGANTTETDLWSYVLPANTLSVDGYGVRITTSGTLGATANNKTVRLYFGATVIASVPTNNFNGETWRFVAEVFRTSAGAQVTSSFRILSASGSTSTITTPAETLTGAVTIKLTGQNGAAVAGDVVSRTALIEFLRAGA